MNDTTYTHSIRDLPENERPRERLAQYGEGVLNTSELLAIILRVGMEGMSAVDLGNYLLKELNGLRGLHAASFDELCALKGLGPAKAAQLKAAIELGDRLRKEVEKDNPTFSNPEAVNDYMHHILSEKQQEEMWVLALNTRNKMVRRKMLYKGTINQSTARMAEIMEVPIMARAAGIIVVHNHPSGDANPSPEDMRFTEELIKAGALMDVAVLDHIIIGRYDFCSIRRTGRINFKSSAGKRWN